MNVLNKNQTKMFKIQTILFIFMCIVWVIFLIFNIQPTVINNNECYFYHQLGFYCPGCGGTRAFEYLLHGNFIKSFIYHPAVIYAFLIFVISEISYIIHILTKGKTKIFALQMRHIIELDLVFIINFIIKNILVFYFQYYIF